jgi:hypothetical protein
MSSRRLERPYDDRLECYCVGYTLDLNVVELNGGPSWVGWVECGLRKWLVL